MLPPLLMLLAGLALLVWSSDRLVEACSRWAMHRHAPPLLVGLLVLGFGTSTAELAVGAWATLAGHPGLALGNAWGSNLANIGLVLGLCALVKPLAVHSRALQRELPLLLGATLLSGLMLGDTLLERWEAWCLLGLVSALLAWGVRSGLAANPSDVLAQETIQTVAQQGPSRTAGIRGSGWVSLLLVLVAAWLVVQGATDIAPILGVGDVTMGLTVLALSTSLPELVLCLTAVRHGEDDMALGHVLGSNLFNTLAVVGLAGTAGPVPVGPEHLLRDWFAMTVLTGALYLMGRRRRGQDGQVPRKAGAALLGLYLAYLGWLMASLPSGA